MILRFSSVVPPPPPPSSAAVPCSSIVKFQNEMGNPIAVYIRLFQKYHFHVGRIVHRFSCHLWLVLVLVLSIVLWVVWLRKLYRSRNLWLGDGSSLIPTALLSARGRARAWTRAGTRAPGEGGCRRLGGGRERVVRSAALGRAGRSA